MKQLNTQKCLKYHKLLVSCLFIQPLLITVVKDFLFPHFQQFRPYINEQPSVDFPEYFRPQFHSKSVLDALSLTQDTSQTKAGPTECCATLFNQIITN